MKTVYVFLAEGFEEIEAITIVDVIRRADIPVTTVSITGKKEINGAHGISVVSDILFSGADYTDSEMLVLPGGMPGATNLKNFKPLADLLREKNAANEKIGAICAAPMVLGSNGLLNGKEAVCFPGFEDQLTGAEILKQPFVTSHNITTSRGAGTAMQFALEIVTRIKGADKAGQLANSMLVNT